MKKIALIILTGSIALGSCKKVVEVEDLDKQINLYFVDGMINSRGTSFNQVEVLAVLKDFDIRDYKHIDSVTFNLGIMTQNLADTGYARLYNLTDNVPIGNSLVIGVTNGYTKSVEFQSNNILKDLPAKKIDIAVQMKSTIDYMGALGNTPYLKLRRN